MVFMRSMLVGSRTVLFIASNTKANMTAKSPTIDLPLPLLHTACNRYFWRGLRLSF